SRAAMFGSVRLVGVAVVVVMVMVMVIADAGAADVVMMALLRRAGRILVADDAGAVLAQLAVHVRVAACEFGDAIEEDVDHFAMVAQVQVLDELNMGKTASGLIGLLVDALSQCTAE